VLGLSDANPVQGAKKSIPARFPPPSQEDYKDKKEIRLNGAIFRQA